MIYGTPEYSAWIADVDARIAGRNALVRAERHKDDAGVFVKLPQAPKENARQFHDGFKAHAELYGLQVR